MHITLCLFERVPSTPYEYMHLMSLSLAAAALPAGIATAFALFPLKVDEVRRRIRDATKGAAEIVEED